MHGNGVFCCSVLFKVGEFTLDIRLNLLLSHSFHNFSGWVRCDERVRRWKRKSWSVGLTNVRKMRRHKQQLSSRTSTSASTHLFTYKLHDSDTTPHLRDGNTVPCEPTHTLTWTYVSLLNNNAYFGNSWTRTRTWTYAALNFHCDSYAPATKRKPARSLTRLLWAESYY